MNEDLLKRVCFNFTHVCNMPCGFCYLPFFGGKPSEAICFSVLQRCKELGFNIITIGGGDPLKYDFISRFVKEAADLGFFVHLDSNYVKISIAELEKIIIHCKLLGIPLDGHDDSSHDGMRGVRGSFSKAIKVASLARSHGIAYKINTVATRKNIQSIKMMPALIDNLCPSRWDIYQFWPMERGNENKESYQLNDEEFSELSKFVNTVSTRTYFTPPKRRASNYFFVNHEGFVYTISEDDIHAYSKIGLIFESDIMEKWGMTYNNTVSCVVHERYLEK